MQGRERRSFTEDYKRQAVELVMSSGRSVPSVAKELGLRDSVLRRWVDKVRQEPTSAAWRPTTQATPMSADQAAEIARLRQENERLRMERDILKKLSSTVARLCGVETASCYPRGWEGSGRSIIGGTIPVKKHGPWVHANLRVVTSPWRRSRLGR
ncbi:transposase [Bradyrhizobium australafricanum]|uniref:transposase n=1 Tax=Bradyrhizobium australafricanum TaxID=2821406 RepID=UPI001CE37696|nr:transposase [Bradyrhizobium australafricanum]MCA6105549.1 transposase [Bradyrhizobium australafricanum]